MRQSYRRRCSVLWVLGFLAATAMGAQNAPGEGPQPVPASLEIVEQSPSVAAGESFVIRVRTFGLDPATITVDVAVFPAAENPEPQLEPGERQPMLSSDDDTAAEVIVASNGLLTVRIPVGSEAGGGELTLPAPGVYPIRLSLTDDDDNAATAITTLLHRPPQPAPAPVGLLLDAGEGALALDELTGILAGNDVLAASIVLHRDVITQLEGDQEAADDFRQALGDRSVIVGTAGPLDPASLLAAGHHETYLLAVAQMRERLAALAIPVDTRAIIIDAPLTRASVDLLVGHGVSTAIAHRLASPGSGEPWPVASGVVEGGDGSLFVVGTDVGTLSAGAAVADGSVAQAHGLLARLAVSEDPAPVIGELARIADPAQIVALMADPGQTSLWTLLPVTDARYQRAAANSVVAPRDTPTQDLGPSAPALDRIEELLDRYEAFHAEGPRSPSHYRNVLMEAFRVDVGPETRSNTLGRVEGELVRAFEQITLPGNQSVTLAAQTAPLPVAVENAADGARFVRVQVTSDKITMAEPDLVLRVEPGTSAVDVPVRTRSLGASPLTVTLLTPDGSQVLSTTGFQVRSTAVPGLGLLISAVGLGGLAAWWYVSARGSGGRGGGGGSDRTDDGPDDDTGPRPDHGRRRPGDDLDPFDLRAGRPLTARSVESGVRVGDSV